VWLQAYLYADQILLQDLVTKQNNMLVLHGFFATFSIGHVTCEDISDYLTGFR